MLYIRAVATTIMKNQHAYHLQFSSWEVKCLLLTTGKSERGHLKNPMIVMYTIVQPTEYQSIFDREHQRELA